MEEGFILARSDQNSKDVCYPGEEESAMSRIMKFSPYFVESGLLILLVTCLLMRSRLVRKEMVNHCILEESIFKEEFILGR